MRERLTQEAASQRTLGAAGTDDGQDRLHALAKRMARGCRHVVQACLREEEWRNADLEFYAIILAGLEEYGDGCQPVGKERTKR